MHSSCVELAIHLASLEDEEDGREIIQSFIDKMEGMIVGARQAHYAFGNPTLVRYLCAQHAFCEMSWTAQGQIRTIIAPQASDGAPDCASRIPSR
jgi:hypothetical protein